MKSATLSKFAGTTAALLTSLAGTAYAQTATTPYASGLTSPSGTIGLGSSQWVADHLQGFCRLDPDPVDATKVKINPVTCVTSATSPGQPSFDSTRNFVYVPDNASQSQGVWRLKFDPATNSVFKTSRVVANRPTLLAPNTPLLKSGGRTVRPTATAVDGGGNLYVGSIRTGNIIKITKPYVAPSDPTQTERVVGQTSDAGGIAGLGFARVRESATVVHQDLYIAEGAAVSVLFDANKCGNCGAAGVVVEFPENLQNPDATPEPVALTSFSNPSSGVAKVFVGLGSHDGSINEVHEYNASIDGLTFARTHALFDPNDTDPSDGTTSLIQGITGLGVSKNGSTLFVGDDPSLLLPDDPSNPPPDEQGRLWRISLQ